MPHRNIFALVWSSATNKFIGSKLAPRNQTSFALATPLKRSAGPRYNVSLICFLLGTLGVFPLILLTPPFQVPDEPQHFFRAYQISEGHLLGTTLDGKSGGMLPSSLIDLTVNFLGTREIHASRPITAQPLRQTLKLIGQPLMEEQREFVDFSGAAFYSPLPYLPQSLAIALGRAAGAGPLALFYFARLANALTAIVVFTCAIRIMPVGREPALVLGLVPMALSLYASVSPDAAVITSALFFTAIALRSLLRGKWATRDVVMAAISATVFCSVKPAYAPLLLIGLPAVFLRRRRKHILLVHAVILAIAVGGTAIWMNAASSLLTFTRSGTNFPAQAAFIVMNPVQYTIAIARSILSNHFYIKQFIGTLGWLTIELPFVAYMLPGLAVLLGIGAGTAVASRLSPSTILWESMLFAACCALIMTALYLSWTPVGNNMVDGVQGRYFLPMLGLASAICSSLVTTPKISRYSVIASWVVVTILLFEIGIADWTVARAYRIFS